MPKLLKLRQLSLIGPVRSIASATMFRVFGHGGCGRAFALDRIRSFRGDLRGRRLYRLILEHEHVYKG
jgi:hypothetical protein